MNLHKEKNFWHVTYVSTGFIFMFTAFIMAQNISGKFMKELGFDDLGFISYAFLYLSWTFVSIFCSHIISKIGSRWSLVLCALLRTIWEASFLIPAMRERRINSG